LAFTVAATLAVTAPTSAIVNGVPDTENAFPNVGALVASSPLPVSFPGLDVPQSFSTCTLIHPRVVLTAGHTVAFMEQLMATDGLTLNAFRVTFAPVVTPDENDPRSFLEIEAVIKHPLFTAPHPGEASLDVAVVILKRPVRRATPVTLPPAGFLNLLRASGELSVGPDGGTPLEVVGYGADEPPPHPVFALPSGIRQWAISGYLALAPSYLTLSQDIDDGEGGSAAGDSGGPAFWTDPDSGQRVQVGIVSIQNRVAAGMGQYCRIDLPEVLDFLDEVIADLD
jgi:hypothetical protein